MIEKLLGELVMKVREMLKKHPTLADINVTFDQKAAVLKGLLQRHYEVVRNLPDLAGMKLLDQIALLDDYQAVNRTYGLLQKHWKDLG